ncbi:hypothetical protein BDB01DRAFT_800594 [Pilobolus umbonatus]|nr:hypothetical protein BDB01DRAFT_800594 [Pilobolus umbonatus]
MISSLLFCYTLFLCLFSIQGLQIPFNAHKDMMKTEGNVMLIKDNVQAHYETIVDGVLSQHNEYLLSELSRMIRDPHQVLFHLRHEAELLLDGLDSVEDVCVAQMPGIIANHIQQLSSQVYSSIYPAVGRIWHFTDNDFRNYLFEAVAMDDMEDTDMADELTSVLEFINMDIGDAIIESITEYDILSVVTQSLLQCQGEYESEDTERVETLSDKLWVALLSSLPEPVIKSSSSPSARKGFLGQYVARLVHDLNLEMNMGVEVLAKTINRDLKLS